MAYIDRELVEREMKYWRIPGAALAVVGDGIEEEFECFGFRDRENGLPFDEDTLFCIASCSKAMTSALIARLVAEGTLDYDKPVNSYIPEFGLFDPDASESFTLRDMLCHRTGFGAHDVLWPADRGELARRMRYIEPCDTFRGRSLYSNVIYALIGYVAEYVTGKTWPDLMKEYIFEPLHMDRTTCTAEGIIHDPDMAQPYYVIDGENVKVPFWNIDGGGPAASVNTTIRDFAKWLRFNIAGGVNEDGIRLIPEGIFADMHSPQIEYKDFLPADKYPCDSYCMGWRDGQYKGHRFQKHSGCIEGYCSFQMFMPDDRIGVLVMLNIQGPAASFSHSMAYTIIDKVLKLGNEDWPHLFHDDGERAPLSSYLGFYTDVASQRLSRSLEGLPMTVPESAFTGEYLNPGHGTVRVYSQEDRLMLHYRDQDLPLRHWGADAFIMENVKADTQTMKVPVTFIKNEFGEVIKVAIGYEPQVEDIIFIRRV